MSIANLLVPNDYTIYSNGLIFTNSEGIESNLDSYEEYLTPEFDWVNGSTIYYSLATMKVVKVGNIVNVVLPLDLITVNITGVNNIVNSIALPERFRPTTAITTAIRTRSNGTAQIGYARIQPTGLIQIFASLTDANFGGANSGFYATSLNWNIN